MTKPLLMCFDFDQTIVQENTDVVACNLLPKDQIEATKVLYSNCNRSWTIYMRKIFELLHSCGINREAIENNINSTPATSGFEELLKNLHSHNCEIIIISDANSIFIEGWLNHHKLNHTVTKIFTNPSWFDDKGLLNIKEYHYQDWCQLSEQNLCKGYVLENYIKERAAEGVHFDKIGYAGDGRNDYCPILKLSEKDLAFPREGYSIMKCLKKSESDNIVKAEIIPWKTGADIWHSLCTKINL
ncbi:hypothetical protein PV325_007608 [Microctonus aethiopoides]|uniref:Pyridoxal phosphate phosphatase PHOSPHO2 n=1 Tax=Microctonus aethiopoides TaxID=144406 RepID=A0AA39KWI8_9HYME|nr:hypothetical protein PV325_007608 [Microctonus aethiopoides]KAK0176365.1 hypothetical protein PV328_000509 [Microctonus aethiopoides]